MGTLKVVYKVTKGKSGGNWGDVKVIGSLSGVPMNRKDSVKIMQYNGSGLYWTGAYEHKNIVFAPDPNKLTPPVYKDPSSLMDGSTPWMNPPPISVPYVNVYATLPTSNFNDVQGNI